jgi:hypothetical protein
MSFPGCADGRARRTGPELENSDADRRRARNGPSSIEGSPFDAEFIHWAKENEDARRLATIPGVGATIPSALIAAIGKAETFEQVRDLAGLVGSVPRQSTTGGKVKLFGISKRGNKYLRRSRFTERGRRCPTSPSAARRSAGGQKRSAQPRSELFKISHAIRFLRVKKDTVPIISDRTARKMLPGKIV